MLYFCWETGASESRRMSVVFTTVPEELVEWNNNQKERTVRWISRKNVVLYDKVKSNLSYFLVIWEHL